MKKLMAICALACCLLVAAPSAELRAGSPEADITANVKADGYRGIWYYNQRIGGRYVFKYSGGLGTYCAKHRPFAVHCDEVDKTFFCYGGTTRDGSLLHMVSYYDHESDTVPRPTILLDKETGDAHDDPVMSVDEDGYIWILSTAHGRARPSYIHRSAEPYSIDEFELVKALRRTDVGRTKMTNFSYAQPRHIPGQGFRCFFTRYGWGAARAICFMRSAGGRNWSQWQRLAVIEQGHYQVGAATAEKSASAFNFHPEPKGLNWRTNLYYVETPNAGRTWRTVDGQRLEPPLTESDNPALVHDYLDEDLNVYLKDIRLDERGRPVILFLTSEGWEPGPENGPYRWRTAAWTGEKWHVRPAMESDHNYDMGPLYLEKGGTWRIIAPTEPGPQPFGTGGEVAMWVSRNRGKSWKMEQQLTAVSPRNHTYVRCPVNADPGFYAMWADGNARERSVSRLYFCTRGGRVFRLPAQMDSEKMEPVPVFRAGK